MIAPEAYFAKLASAEPPPRLRRYASRARDELARLHQHVRRIGTMLDVGAGLGYALHLSAADEKFAIAPDLQSRKYLDHIGARLIDWAGTEPDRYDLILVSHVLEHFSPDDVRPRLDQLVRGRRPRGLLYTEVCPAAWAGNSMTISMSLIRSSSRPRRCNAWWSRST